MMLERSAGARVTSSPVVTSLRASLAHGAARVLALAALCTMSLSCAEDLDLTRTHTARGTLGAEVYEVVCLRIAAGENPTDVSARRSRRLCEGSAPADADTPPRLAALDAQRARLVDALDRTLPEPLEDDLSRFLLQILPLYDPPDDVLPAQTRAAADLLDTLARDDDALDALARLGQRRGYRPLRLALGVARPLLAYPAFDGLADRALATIDTGGTAGAEWDQLLRVTALEMATANVDPPPAAGTRGTLAIARELLFTEDAAFGAGPARYLVARDLRGLAQPDLRGGAVPAPFVDDDGDGLADIDALGRFVAADGARLALPTPFAIRGEATVRRDAAGRSATMARRSSAPSTPAARCSPASRGKPRRGSRRMRRSRSISPSACRCCSAPRRIAARRSARRASPSAGPIRARARSSTCCTRARRCSTGPSSTTRSPWSTRCSPTTSLRSPRSSTPSGSRRTAATRIRARASIRAPISGTTCSRRPRAWRRRRACSRR
jgi:hypothetical protein